MREILFRGKRVDNGKWHYGNFVKLTNYSLILNPDPDGTRTVIPETVGQFTGLLDKKASGYSRGIFYR